jgi:hypothetical protein
VDSNAPFKVKSASDALDAIRVGGGHVLLLAHQSLNDVRMALEKGHFTEALEATQQLQAKVHQLAGAQAGLGLLADNVLVKAGELKDGMMVPGVGPITDVGPCPGCGNDKCNNVSFTVAGQPMILDADVEMVIEAAR